MAEGVRWLPVPTPETQHFWGGVRIGELRLQRCLDCGEVYFPPRPFCRKCLSRNVEGFVASGRGTLLSYVISHRSVPGFEAPYSIAYVQLEEGPTMISNVIGCQQEPEHLPIDAQLEVVFTKVSDEIYLPQFKLSHGGV
jgi:uncharacterized OB-fold protein